MVRRRRAPQVIGALLVALVAGCAGSVKETPVSQRRPYVLMVFIEPWGSVPLPAPFKAAAIRFEEARIDYEQRHRFTEAARQFLEAARLLLHVDGFHANTAAANRLSCYRNAWAAFSAVGKLAEGRAALTAAAQADPVQADRIHEIIDGS
jgi:hypothetical protein